MEEVKICFQKRQYKNCSGRCIQILDGVKDSSQPHPLYSTWMAFYAAASLEQLSRALHVNSTEKLPLLRQCLYYYEKAESYLQQVPCSLNEKVTQNQKCSFSTPSNICPTTEGNLSSIELISSSSPPPTLPHPVSPTPYTNCGSEKVTTTNRADEIALQNQTAEIGHISIPQPSEFPSRYLLQLMGMQTQLRYHITSVSKQIIALQEAKKARRSNRPTLFIAFCVGGIDGMSIEEMKRDELKTRIERLREVGWKRKRFDAGRYQRLCEQALAELDG